VVLAVLVAVGDPATAAAGDLKNAIRDLYGGNGITLQPSPPGFPSHAPHFTTASLSGLESLGSSITSSITSVALPSTVSGFTFDIERGVPVRTTDSLGPLLAERAPTLGAGKLNVGFFYTRVDFKKFQGQDLDKLHLTFAHEDINGDGVLGDGPGNVFDFERDEILVDLDLDIKQEIFSLFATYGITRNWDIGVIVPIVHVTFRADAEATIVRNSAISSRVHNFGPDSDSPTSRTGGEATGIGDVILRTKYNFLRSRPYWPDLAVLGQVKLATGDEDNLLGTGETDFLAMLVASKTFGPVNPHINAGYEVSTAGSQENKVRYVAGFDARLHPRLSAAVDVIGRWKPDGNGIDDSVADVAVSARWNIYRTLLLDAAVEVPINKNTGLRPDLIWTVGVDYTF
jgi:hypothetical protein